jgi:hypothetical protein
MLENFFEHLINQVYQNFRVLSVWIVKPLPFASSYIKFGGWEMSYNWKGLTRPTKEVVGNISVITKTVFFNYKYALQLMRVDNDTNFSFAHFVRTIAHEIAHCLLIDHEPKYLEPDSETHNESHRLLTNQLEKYLWTLPEIQELSVLQDGKKIKFLH